MYVFDGLNPSKTIHPHLCKGTDQLLRITNKHAQIFDHRSKLGLSDPIKEQSSSKAGSSMSKARDKEGTLNKSQVGDKDNWSKKRTKPKSRREDKRGKIRKKHKGNRDLVASN